MKKLLLPILFFIAFSSCKKDVNSVALHYSITASDEAVKFVDSDKPRFEFTGKTYEGTYTVASGISVRLSCGYSSSMPNSTIRIVVKKDGQIIQDQTNSQRVDLDFVAP